MKAKFLVALVIAVMCGGAVHGQTPRVMPTSLFADKKAIEIGDVVTILLMEYTSGSNEAATNSGIEDVFDASVAGAGAANVLGSFGLKAGVNNNSKSNGNTSRQGSLRGKLSAKIVEMLPNGQLKLEGQRKVVINGEEQTTVLSGVVRRTDILSDNTVFSYLISDAAISYKGRGQVDQASQPGYITRFINWLF